MPWNLRTPLDDDAAQGVLMGLCARATLEPELAAQLQAACERVPDFTHFLRRAEDAAMAPLLHRHLSALPDAKLPAEIRRGLAGLALRHKRATTVRAQVQREVLERLHAAGLPALVLKGSALAYWVYPDPALRPRRDIDLLLSPPDARRAAELLQREGFRAEGHGAPHHLPPLARQEHGLHLEVELHHSLGLISLADGRPLPGQSFAELRPRARTLQSEAGTLLVPSPEDMLFHVYRHGLACPLDWRLFEYGAFADLALGLEAWSDTLDLELLSRRDPALVRALPVVHRVAPLGPRARARLGLTLDAEVLPAKLYWGWPRMRSEGAPLRHALATLFPHHRFLRLRHGRTGPLGLARAWTQHLRELARLALSSAPVGPAR